MSRSYSCTQRITHVDLQLYNGITQLPSITELSIRDKLRSMTPLARCVKLRTLSMQLPSDQQIMMEQFTSTSLASGQRLETLSVDLCFRTHLFGYSAEAATGIVARHVEFIQACFALPSLTKLTLINHTMSGKSLQLFGELLPPQIKYVEGNHSTVRMLRVMQWRSDQRGCSADMHCGWFTTSHWPQHTGLQTSGRRSRR